MIDCGFDTPTFLHLALRYKEYPEIVTVLLSIAAVDELPLTSESLGLLVRYIPYLVDNKKMLSTVDILQQLDQVIKYSASKAYELLINSQLLRVIGCADDLSFKSDYYTEVFFEVLDLRDASMLLLLTYLVEELNLIPLLLSLLESPFDDGNLSSIRVLKCLQAIFQEKDRWIDLIPKDLPPPIAKYLQDYFPLRSSTPS